MAEMGARGRPGGFVMSHEHRVKIQNSNILNALIEHAEGTREMSSTQVTAALGLLRKALPDLTAIEATGADGEPLIPEDAASNRSLAMAILSLLRGAASDEQGRTDTGAAGSAGDGATQH